MFVYALIGKQFFSGVMYDSDGEVSRYNFNDMGSALTTMFVVLTGENWNEIMQITVLNFGEGAIFFFITAMAIGNFMLLNLFLAILLKFIEDRGVIEDEEDKLLNKIKQEEEGL